MTRAQAVETLEIQSRMERSGFKAPVGQIALCRCFLRDEAEAESVKQKLDTAQENGSGAGIPDVKTTPPTPESAPSLRQILQTQVLQVTIVVCAYLALRWAANWSAALLIPIVSGLNGMLGAILPHATRHLRRVTRATYSLGIGAWIGLALATVFADDSYLPSLWHLLLIRIPFALVSAALLGLCVWRGSVNWRWAAWNAGGHQMRLRQLSERTSLSVGDILDWTLRRMDLHPTRYLLGRLSKLMLRSPMQVSLWLYSLENDRIVVRAHLAFGDVRDVQILGRLRDHINKGPCPLRPYHHDRFSGAVQAKIEDLRKAAGSTSEGKHLSIARRAALGISDRFDYVSTAGYVLARNKAIDAEEAKLCPTWNSKCIEEFVKKNHPSPQQKEIVQVNSFAMVPVRNDQGECVWVLGALCSQASGLYLEDRTALLEAAEKLREMLPPTPTHGNNHAHQN